MPDPDPSPAPSKKSGAASPTTIYAVIGAIGTGIAALGVSLVSIGATAGAPPWFPIAALVCGAIGGAVSVTAKILGGLATPDKPEVTK